MQCVYQVEERNCFFLFHRHEHDVIYTYERALCKAICKKQVFDQQFSEKLVSADFGKQLLHILIDKAVMRQRAAASLLGA